MTVKKSLDVLLTSTNPLDAFKTFDNPLKIAVYKALLFSHDDRAAACLKSIHDNTQFKDLKEAFQYERNRYFDASAGAIYQKYLYEKAISEALLKNADDLLFDPQGRLIYELKLTDEDHDELFIKILKEHNKKKETWGIIVNRQFLTPIGELKALLGGRTPTDTTLCSIDLMGIVSKDLEPLQGKFTNKFTNSHVNSYSKNTSIVPLFEETFAHLNLMVKTYKVLAPQGDITEHEWESIRKDAALKIQKKVADIYNGLEQVNNISEIEKFNTQLKEQRVPLAHEAKKLIFRGMIDVLQDQKKKNRKEILTFMQTLVQGMDKHSFTHRTATGFDYFHTSNELNMGSLTTGTQDTAHHKPHFKPDINGKRVEDQAAFRRTTYTYLNESQEFLPTAAVSARIPSPALIFNKLDHKDIVDDLKEKYRFLYDEMQRMRGGKPGPVVENLLTSFHSAFFDITGDRKNQQRKSALYMIEAMHGFNNSRLKTENNFLFVQNIGTNRHTKALSYSGPQELAEITLCSEIALLYTLKENGAYFSPKMGGLINQIHEKTLSAYKKYLEDPNRPKYFTQSPDGKELIVEIKAFKKNILEQNLDSAPNTDLNTLMSHALLKMVAHNHHWDPRYGQLTQTLSMCLQSALASGCKSAIDRDERIKLRFDLLKSIEAKEAFKQKKTAEEDAIYHELQAYITTPKAIPDAIRSSIAIAVKEKNLYGRACAVCREDVGAAAKISSFSWAQDLKTPFAPVIRFFAGLSIILFGILPSAILAAVPLPYCREPIKFFTKLLKGFFDTNNAEDREMKADSTGAKKLQAHKGQDKLSRKALIEALKSSSLFQEQDKLTSDDKKAFRKNDKQIEKCKQQFKQSKPEPSSYEQVNRLLKDPDDQNDEGQNVVYDNKLTSLITEKKPSNEVSNPKESNTLQSLESKMKFPAKKEEKHKYCELNSHASTPRGDL